MKGEPKVSQVFSGAGVNPNGLYPSRGGMLDGLYEMKDRSLLATDWVSGSLFHWSIQGGMQKLATGFKGPADLCVMPGRHGLTVIVPDLVKSELRIVELGQ